MIVPRAAIIERLSAAKTENRPPRLDAVIMNVVQGKPFGAPFSFATELEAMASP
jgi:hypothetical protein